MYLNLLNKTSRQETEMMGWQTLFLLNGRRLAFLCMYAFKDIMMDFAYTRHFGGRANIAQTMDGGFRCIPITSDVSL